MHAVKIRLASSVIGSQALCYDFLITSAKFICLFEQLFLGNRNTACEHVERGTEYN